MKIHAPILLMLFAEFALGSRGDLSHGEVADVTAHVHITTDADDMKSVYLSFDNHYLNTISCSGEFFIITDKNTRTEKYTFDNLRVYPQEVFGYRVIYPIRTPSDQQVSDIPYPSFEASCRSWNFLHALPHSICLMNADTHAEICASRSSLYPFMIGEFWLGSCSCRSV